MAKFGEILGTIGDTFQIGLGGTGSRALRFVNQFTGILSWTPTANRTITIPDKTGILSTLAESYTYSQSSLPTSPSDGETWRELSGNKVIERWIYNATNSRWETINYLHYSPSGAVSLTVGTTRAITVPNIALYSSILVENVRVRAYSASAHSVSNFFTFNFQWLNGNGTATNMTSLNTQTLPAGTGGTTTNFSTNLTTVISAIQLLYFQVVVTLSGTASVNYNLYLLVRGIR